MLAASGASLAAHFLAARPIHVSDRVIYEKQERGIAVVTNFEKDDSYADEKDGGCTHYDTARIEFYSDGL
jgi:hypothetical protein